jgi:gliding motility-associated lipoprotein GldD
MKHKAENDPLSSSFFKRSEEKRSMSPSGGGVGGGEPLYKTNTPNLARLIMPALSAFLLLLCLFLSSCHGDYTPKPKAYPRVVFPERKYEMYDPKDCPFKFEKPVYANVTNDTIFFGQKILSVNCWLNVNFPTLNGTINLTYKEINDTMKLERLIEDAHKLSFMHTTKADYIDEIRIQNDHGVGGILYDVGGNAASNVQFFLTDSTHHFLRGALYFNSEPNSDSMAPVVTFVKEDMKRMLKTFQWK